MHGVYTMQYMLTATVSSVAYTWISTQKKVTMKHSTYTQVLCILCICTHVLTSGM